MYKSIDLEYFEIFVVFIVAEKLNSNLQAMNNKNMNFNHALHSFLIIVKDYNFRTIINQTREQSF